MLSAIRSACRGCAVLIRHPSPATQHRPSLLDACISRRSYASNSSNIWNFRLTPNLEQKLAHIQQKHQDVGKQLSKPDIPSSQIALLSKELSDLNPIACVYNEIKKTRKDLAELSILKSSSDAEMKELAEAEEAELATILTNLEREIALLLLPKDVADEGNVVLEVRAGAGGIEAALFAEDLLGMYERFAHLQGWKFEVMNESVLESGRGIKEVSASISGNGVFKNLKFESGVHRVQRVPTTESQGRIHTSTVTVAILPEPQDIDVQINEKDLRIDVYRASGAGGQHVNRTESAVRITHLPSGIVVAIQDERSQHKNKHKAFKILRARLYDLERSKAQFERRDARRKQIGTGDRSERIRTYNFPQGRVTDHRISYTIHSIDQVLNGTLLEELVHELTVQNELEELARLGE